MAVQNKKGYYPPAFIALGFAVQSDWPNTFQTVNQALAEDDEELSQLIRYPFYDPVRSDPRYLQALKQLNLQP